jgi:cell division protein FtsB
LAALNTLSSLSKSVTENAMGIPTAFEHLQTAEKHIEQLTAQMKKDQQNKQHELAAKTLESELAALKKTLQKERETAAASAASFNSIQNKLINANSAQDEELEKLRKEKQSLCDQITSLSVFEQGVADMRTLLDDAVHARDEVKLFSDFDLTLSFFS